ncbi:YkgJ family cysteine cluster protein [Ignicoccus hospitalis]|nr:YkgJ family cysteine cluster protein [Ignicoccus hospitalis]
MFKCPYNEECKRCCVFEREDEMPVVFEDEKEELERMGQREFVELLPGLYRWVIKGRCPFNDPETGRCKIHEKKPLSCKMYPLNVRVKDGKVFIEVSRACSWVKHNWEEVVNNPPERVFPEEWKALNEVLRRLRGLGLV